MRIFRLFTLFCSLLILWQIIVLTTRTPPYILPGPLPVALAIIDIKSELFVHTQTTLIEIVAGLFLGSLLGSISALVMTLSPLLKRWLLPVLVMSQAIPVFALAPILVLWLGYGMFSKIAMAVLIIFFPVTSSFYYGMQRTSKEILELCRIMRAKPLNVLRFIIIPGALPAFGSGIRVAAAVAPIGAIVGEWVGSSSGLGFYMLHANARMQTANMFAALAVLAALSISLYFLVDLVINKLIYWESSHDIFNEKTS